MDNSGLKSAIPGLRVAIFRTAKNGHDLEVLDGFQGRQSRKEKLLQQFDIAGVVHFLSPSGVSFRDPPGIRTQDPNIKSVVLYLLS